MCRQRGLRPLDVNLLLVLDDQESIFFMLTPISIPWFQKDVDCRESGSSVFRLVRSLSFTREVRGLQHGGKYLAANGTSSDALYLTDKVKARPNRFKLMCI